jgi:hypothetical protein
MCSLMNSGSFSSSQLLAPYSTKAAHEVARHGTPVRLGAEDGGGGRRLAVAEQGMRDRAAESGVCGEKRRRWERRAVIGIGLNLSECVWVKTSKYIWSLLL